MIIKMMYFIIIITNNLATCGFFVTDWFSSTFDFSKDFKLCIHKTSQIIDLLS